MKKVKLTAKIAGAAIVMTCLTNHVALAAQTGEITSSVLKIRTGAGTSYPAIGVLTKGTAVSITEKSNGFYKIDCKGVKGYVSQDYVKILSGQAVTPSPSKQQTTSVSSTKEQSTKQESTQLKALTVKVITPTLNIRVKPGTQYTSLGLLLKDTLIEVYEKSNGFYRINYRGAKAYISSDCVTTVTTPLPPSSSKTNTTNNVPNTDAKKNDTIKTNVKKDNTSNQSNKTAVLTPVNIVEYAKTFLGIPYVWGGASSKGYDCSSFVQAVYKRFDVTLPRTTYYQINSGATVKKIEDLNAGDLIFFSFDPKNPLSPGHVGMYIGNKQFIHAPKPGDVIKIEKISSYYTKSFITGRRLIK